MNRRNFIQIVGGVLAALRTRRTNQPRPRGQVEPLLLEAGLCAMARADGWFEAHWGAALIAGAYLCSEAGLAEETRSAIRGELEVLRLGNEDACRSFARAPAREESIASIEESLLPALDGGLREHGHAVIYTALATRALDERPELAIPAIVEPICGWNRRIARVSPKRAPQGVSGYRDGRHLVEQTFESLLRFEPLLGHPRIKRPNFTHWITHTEALRRLGMKGKARLWAAGCAGHRAHIAADVPSSADDGALDRSGVSLAAICSEGYWRDAARQGLWHRPWSKRGNPNGDWIASGHLFKVLYAFHHVSEEVEDDDLVQRCARVVFERYFDPEVRGG